MKKGTICKLAVIALALLAITVGIFALGKRKSRTERYAMQNEGSYAAAEDSADAGLGNGAGDVPDIYTAQEGDIVEFGSYEIDGDTENGYEPIEWLVLKIRGRRNQKKLLFSLRCIDALPFNSAPGYASWENSSIREWLDNTFYEIAFSEEEKTHIKTTKLGKTENSMYGTQAESTESKVFLPSCEQFKYFKEDYEEYMKVDATVYVTNMGLSNFDGYWLRTPAIDYDGAMYVSAKGGLVGSGTGCVKPNMIRPMIWIRTSS